MATAVERLDADTFLAREFPRGTQLIDGVVVLNQPRALHQHVLGAIFYALMTWTRGATGRGTVSLPLDIVLDAYNVLVPDLLRYADGLDLRQSRPSRPPDLVVEVRSPSTWRYDIGRKRELYERHGVGELWLVDTAAATIVVYRRSAPAEGFDVALELAAGETLQSPLLPGFAAPVGDLVPAPEPS